MLKMLHCAALLLLFVTVPINSLTVMSVDFGSEFMKIAVVAVSSVEIINLCYSNTFYDKLHLKVL